MSMKIMKIDDDVHSRLSKRVRFRMSLSDAVRELLDIADGKGAKK